MRSFGKPTILLGIYLFAFCLDAVAQTSERGVIEQVINEVRDAMPGYHSERFVIPTNTQLDAWTTIFNALKTADYSTAAQQAATFGYECVAYYDTVEVETLFVLKERIPVQRGWGTYILNTRGTQDLTIEVPHARSDTNTCIQGIRTFLKLNAQWFFMAGTHRYANTDTSSDMAHVTQSVFYRGHVTVASARAIQLHGFDRTNPIYNGYPQIVISNGTTSPPAILTTLKANYELQAFTAGVFSSSTYSQLWRLGATQNKQGQWSNANGKAFVHAEQELPVRIDSMNIAKTMNALYSTYTPPMSVSDYAIPAAFSLDQNYPNPFNPTTTISYIVCVGTGPAGTTLAGRHALSLRVYDVLGREVATLMKDVVDPGRYSVTWNAEGYGSGVYFYRLESGGFSQTKRMILMK